MAGDSTLGTKRITWRIAAPKGQEREISSVITQQKESGQHTPSTMFLYTTACRRSRVQKDKIQRPFSGLHTQGKSNCPQRKMRGSAGRGKCTWGRFKKKKKIIFIETQWFQSRVARSMGWVPHDNMEDVLEKFGEGQGSD